MKSTSLAIFASGSGSNAEAISAAFAETEDLRVALLVCNCKGARVLRRFEQLEIESLLISNKLLEERPEELLEELSQRSIDFIVLAGFLRLLPALIVRAYRGRILNIHPSLLPKYGGAGMYGRHVHEAVLRNKEPESGITIHQVSEVYDRGPVVFQTPIPVKVKTPEALARTINKLEMQHYPKVIAREVRRVRRSNPELVK